MAASKTAPLTIDKFNLEKIFEIELSSISELSKNSIIIYYINTQTKFDIQIFYIT